MGRSADVERHAYQFIEGFSASPQAFYRALEFSLMRRQVPALQNTRVEYHEGGVFSAKREYLRLTRDRITFEVCAAPFGTGFFVSWRLVRCTRSWAKLAFKIGLGFFLVSLAVTFLVTLTAGVFVGLYAFFLLMTLLLIGTLLNLIVYSALRSWVLNFQAQVAMSPALSELYLWITGEETYYRVDTMLMFQEAVGLAIAETIQTMVGAKDLSPSALEADKPVMHDLFEAPAT